MKTLLSHAKILLHKIFISRLNKASLSCYQQDYLPYKKVDHVQKNQLNF